MDRLMRALLETIGERTPVSYAEVLVLHEPVRPCKVSNQLRRLQTRELVEYDAGKYYITELGREALNETRDSGY